MVILFLLALLLAWPTMGLSLVAYVAFFVFKSYVTAKSRMHDADQRRAVREVLAGGRHVPTWAGRDDKRQEFIESIQALAVRKGVPQTFLWAILADKETFQGLIFLAGAMEREGASFVGQQMAVCDRLLEIWRDAPLSVKNLSR
jgi:hypothetical protein